MMREADGGVKISHSTDPLFQLYRLRMRTTGLGQSCSSMSNLEEVIARFARQRHMQGCRQMRRELNIEQVASKQPPFVLPDAPSSFA